MTSRPIRRACEQKLRHLDLPAGPLTVDGLAGHVAARRERPLHLRGLSMVGSGVSGAWIPTDKADYVFYESDTTPRHQAQIIAHELGHMVCDHSPALHGTIDQIVALAPGAALHMLGRDGYSDDQEREAEHMADLLVGRLDSTADPAPADPVAAALQHRTTG
jgi:hypothetical protein